MGKRKQSEVCGLSNHQTLSKEPEKEERIWQYGSEKRNLGNEIGNYSTCEFLRRNFYMELIEG